MEKKLMRKIERKEAIVSVVGLGYVGLPLALRCLASGFNVVGFDIDANKIDCMRIGHSPIQDISDFQLEKALATKKFILTANAEDLKNIDIFLICVPTPLNNKYEPDISFVENAADIVLGHCKENVLISLESSTYPGTTKQIFGERCAHRDIFLAYSPERVDPGNSLYLVKNTPKVVGVDDPESYKLAKIFYQMIIDEVHMVSSTEVAELSKLLENSFRSINIAFMNEIAGICEHLGIDVWETIDAAATKPFGFMKFTPGVGVGGHCIPLDPMYLEWVAKKAGCSSEFLNLAHKINTTQPQVIVNNALAMLKEQQKPIKEAKIVIFGMGYKGDSSDIRESKSVEIFNQFYLLGAKVDYIDANVDFILDCDGNQHNGIAEQSLITGEYDMVIITNSCSKHDYQVIQNSNILIYDVINLLKSDKENIIVYGKKRSYRNCKTIYQKV